MKKLLWALLILAVGCIPLVDEKLPTIVEIEDGEVRVRDLYYYDDSIVFKIAFRDNNSLDSVRIDIRPSENRALTASDFRYTERIKVKGRRLERTFRVVVPKFSTLGDYQLRVRVLDKYNNRRENFWKFQLKADSIAPTFEGLALQLPRSQDPRADYVACRSQVVRVTGRVRDNLLLKRVGVNFSGTLNGQNQEEIVRVLYNRFISLDTFFKSNLVIPTRSNDGDILTMTFYAYDSAIDNRATAPDPFSGNLRTQTIRVLITCDDQPPTISVGSVSPRFVSGREVALVQEGTFRISSATASDDKALLAVYAAFNRDDSDLILVDSVLAGGAKTLDLVAAGMNLNFTAPRTARIGDVFRVTLFAVDTALNYSEFYTIKLNIIENQPPIIQITDTYVSGERVAFSSNENIPTSVSAGSVIRFDGKVDDDYRLSRIDVSWQGVNVFSTTAPTTPFDLSSFQTGSTFTVSPVVQLFTLTVRAVDEKGLVSEKIYYFKVI